MSLPRRFLIASTLAAVLAGPAVAQTGAAHASLPPSQALRTELAQALARGQPLVVMISLEGCAWCKVVRTNYLVPMHQRGSIAVVQVDMRNNRSTTDFSGQPTTHDQWARGQRITVAPTLLFFGPGGREVAERMEGGMLPDFYSAYLDERLQTARQALAQR